MERVEFIVLGSKGDEYKVVFEKNIGRVHAFCSCPAGESGTYCKHRFQIMDGQYDSIVSGNANEIERVKAMLKNSELQRKYEDVIQASAAHEETKNLLNISKRELARAMYR